MSSALRVHGVHATMLSKSLSSQIPTIRFLSSTMTSARRCGSSSSWFLISSLIFGAKSSRRAAMSLA